jgi:uncharacterized protein with HEPN domain
MSRSPKNYLLHILDETLYLLEFSSNLAKEDFLEDKTLKRSFVRSLEIIGEATKNLSEDFRKSYPSIQWKRMAGMRDKLIHEYFGVDYDVVWDVIINEIPQLHSAILIIINQLN